MCWMYDLSVGPHFQSCQTASLQFSLCQTKQEKCTVCVFYIRTNVKTPYFFFLSFASLPTVPAGLSNTRSRVVPRLHASFPSTDGHEKFNKTLRKGEWAGHFFLMLRSKTGEIIEDSDWLTIPSCPRVRNETLTHSRSQQWDTLASLSSCQEEASVQLD